MQVLVFGGGISVTWLTGEFTNNAAWMGVAVLAHSTFTADSVIFEKYDVARGTIYGGFGRGVFTGWFVSHMPLVQPG